MAGLLDRLIKRRLATEESEGLLSPAPTATTAAPITAPATPADPSSPWLTIGSPEYSAWRSSYEDQWRDPVSMGWKPGTLYETDPAASQGDWRSGDNILTRAGAANYAFNPDTNKYVGIGADGKPISGTEFDALTNDRDWYNAALAMIAGAGAGYAAGAGGGAGAGSTAATTGAETVAPGLTYEGAAGSFLAGDSGSLLGGAGSTAGWEAAGAGMGGYGATATGGSSLPSVLGSSGASDTVIPSSLPSTGSGTSTPTPTITPSTGNWLDDLGAWLKDPKNAELAKLMFGAGGAALSASGGDSGSGYSYSGPMPTISREGWSPTAQQQSMALTPAVGLLSPQGNSMSGLWRYAGLLGGGGK